MNSLNIIDANLHLSAKLLIQNIKSKGIVNSLKDVEFKVYSQWGEDGIIQYIINNIDIVNKTFIEFGVENYTECNSRFLLVNDNWKGLIIDGSRKNILNVKKSDLYWKYSLQAIDQFVTADNINSIIENTGFGGDIGLLSIDIDGMDYWIWDAINVINPRIVICEYNSIFGKDAPVTVPLDNYFNRTKAHFSNLYYGASISALCYLGESKGYDFIGSNSAGNNLFFVRHDLNHNFKTFTAKEGYVYSHIRESRDVNSSLTFLDGEKRFELIKDLPVQNVITREMIRLEEVHR